MESTNLMLGDASIAQWLYGLVIGILGLVCYKLWTYTKRSEKGSSFNIVYWLTDNFREIILSLMLFYVAFRFHSDLIDLLSENFSFPIITNRYLFVFVLGLMITLILGAGRKFFRLRAKKYANGNKRSIGGGGHQKPPEN